MAKLIVVDRDQIRLSLARYEQMMGAQPAEREPRGAVPPAADADDPASPPATHAPRPASGREKTP